MHISEIKNIWCVQNKTKNTMKMSSLRDDLMDVSQKKKMRIMWKNTEKYYANECSVKKQKKKTNSISREFFIDGRL